ncbi:MAG: peptidylprolyl isomerase [Myxococcota bacterium]
MSISQISRPQGFVHRASIVAAALCVVLAWAVPAASKGKPDAMAALESFISMQGIDKSKPGWKSNLPEPIEADFSGQKVTWKLRTNLGPIEVKLMPDVAPKHVTSTVYLTTLGFYDNTRFHRVIPGFMAQGGDPTGTGRGGPGYQYSGEFDPEVKHDKGGLLSMANAGPGTDGSQFFLTFVATPWLNNKHTIFGEVVSGMDVLKKMEEKGTRSGRPTAELKIEKATIQFD